MKLWIRQTSQTQTRLDGFVIPYKTRKVEMLRALQKLSERRKYAIVGKPKFSRQLNQSTELGIVDIYWVEAEAAPKEAANDG